MLQLITNALIRNQGVSASLTLTHTRTHTHMYSATYVPNRIWIKIKIEVCFQFTTSVVGKSKTKKTQNHFLLHKAITLK